MSSPDHASEEELFIDVSGLITEDDEPVDSIHHAYNMTLLEDALRASWQPVTADGTPRSFIVVTNVGLFEWPRNPAIVPDCMVAIDVVPTERQSGDHPNVGASYYLWEHGKPPDVCVELVSEHVRDELGEKKARYERMRVPFYVVWDLDRRLGKKTLHAFQLHGASYIEMTHPVFPHLGLSLVEWQGTYAGWEHPWLRWADLEGRLLPTGVERTAQEAARAEQEAARAEQEAARAEQEAARAEQEAARAKQEAARAKQEAARAKQEAARAEAAAATAATATSEADRLRAKLIAAGIDPDA